MRPGDPDYWIYTETPVLQELLDSVAYWNPSERELFVSSIRAELASRGESAVVRSLTGEQVPQRRPHSAL